MSRAYLCDCCGRFFDPDKERGSELNRNNFRLGSFAIDANKDLCADCTKQVENFIQVLETAKRDGMIVQFKVFSDSNKEEQNDE